MQFSSYWATGRRIFSITPGVLQDEVLEADPMVKAMADAELEAAAAPAPAQPAGADEAAAAFSAKFAATSSKPAAASAGGLSIVDVGKAGEP